VVSVRRATDVVFLQRRVRFLAHHLGFADVAAWSVATAASELATNILKYAHTGEVALRAAPDGEVLELVARDQGPGISNIPEALQDRVSQGRDLTKPENLDRPHSLGCGLPAVARLMDSVVIDSAPGCGTTVHARKARTSGRRAGVAAEGVSAGQGNSPAPL
jgi:serine/threonine-protein kinase RsbT